MRAFYLLPKRLACPPHSITIHRELLDFNFFSLQNLRYVIYLLPSKKMRKMGSGIKKGETRFLYLFLSYTYDKGANGLCLVYFY